MAAPSPLPNRDLVPSSSMTVSIRSFATIRPDGTGESAAARVLHLQSRSGQPHPGHTRPTAVE